MGHYAILAPAYTGHLNPLSVLGRSLMDRGHRVTVIAPPDAQAKATREGLGFRPIAAPEFPPGAWDQWSRGIGELAGLKASRFVGRWLGLFAKGILRDLPECLARERFDGVVMDQICFGTEAVCEAMKVPMAVACSALALHSEPGIPPSMFPWGYSDGLSGCLRNRLGLFLSYATGWPVTVRLIPYRVAKRLPAMRFSHMNEMPPSLVQVAQQPREFDLPRRRLPDHVHFTGPWIRAEPKTPSQRDADKGEGFPWERLDGRPLIYASLGTLQNGVERVFRLIAEACAGFAGFQLVLSLGRRGASLSSELPGNPVVVDYAPQAMLLRRAALVITHGGLNTTLESLAHGIPPVVLPIANDQPGIGARVRHLGLGEVVWWNDISVETIRSAVGKVVAGGGYRDRARAMAERIGSVNGPVVAAELIERAFTTRVRIVR